MTTLSSLLAASLLVAALTPAEAEVAAATDTLTYDVILAGNHAGYEKSWPASDGALVSHFEFNDRGRGSKVDERIAFGPRGVPSRVEITGNDYFKNPVAERFTYDGSTAAWKNSAEDSSTTSDGGAFYLSIDGAPEELAALARALLASPQHTLPLLPVGQARIDSLGSRLFNAGGDSLTAIQYAISGLGFTPNQIWLDPDGRLFASGSTWFMVIRAGWGEAAPEIVRAQQRTDSLRTVELARRLAHHPATAVAFRHGDLFEAETGRIRPGMTVVVNGARIAAVGPDGKVKIPPGAEIIDARGKTILPGLWDMHVHIGDDDGLFQLAAGVTTVRDLANDTDELLVRRRRFEEETLLGPRVIMAGIIDGPGPFAGPTKVLVDNPDSARAAVRRYAQLGYVQIKIYSSVKPELVPAIIDEAHRLGLRVSGHIPAFMTAEQAVTLGFDEIQHVNFLFLNFWADSVPDTRTPARFTAVAERAAGLDLGSERVQALVRLLQQHATVLDPTLNAFENLLVARKGTIDPSYAPIADRLPPTVRRGLLTGGLPVPDGKDQRYRDSFAALLRMVRMMYDAGIRIVAGTDAFAGFAYHRELELYQQAGIPAPEVLRLATLGAARVMKMDRELGSVAVGKLADIILVGGNPAERVSDIRRVSLVMKNGTIYDPAALYQAVGVK